MEEKYKGEIMEERINGSPKKRDAVDQTGKWKSFITAVLYLTLIFGIAYAMNDAREILSFNILKSFFNHYSFFIYHSIRILFNPLYFGFSSWFTISISIYQDIIFYYFCFNCNDVSFWRTNHITLLYH